VNGRMMGLCREDAINSYIWCAVGALLGAAAGLPIAALGRVGMIENVLVGMFGAFIGGDFLVDMFGSLRTGDSAFHIGSLGVAIAAAIGMLVVLHLMRGAVGPMRATRSKAGQRRP
jgi:uncharacterized membrane protein YeaQ/YmgE (transglycosylase-associated protein family)